MLAVTKWKVIHAGRDHLVLDRFPGVIRSFARLGKSERLEGQRIFVNLLIQMDRTGNSSNMVTLWDERAVRKCEIRHGLALQRNWKRELARRLLRTG